MQQTQFWPCPTLWPALVILDSVPFCCCHGFLAVRGRSGWKQIAFLLYLSLWNTSASFSKTHYPELVSEKRYVSGGERGTSGVVKRCCMPVWNGTWWIGFLVLPSRVAFNMEWNSQQSLPWPLKAFIVRFTREGIRGERCRREVHSSETRYIIRIAHGQDYGGFIGYRPSLICREHIKEQLERLTFCDLSLYNRERK